MVAAQQALRAAGGGEWAPLFCGSEGLHLSRKSFDRMITQLLREDLRLGAGATAYSLRRAAVDHFMGGDYTDEQRTGANIDRWQPACMTGRTAAQHSREP
jgi:hypothetical protein